MELASFARNRERWLCRLVNPFARLMLFPHIAAYRLSGHTAAASSVGWSVPSAWHGTALHSGRSGRHQCAGGEGACRQADDHRFGQHGCSAEPSIVLENGSSFARVNRTRRLLHRPGHKRPLPRLCLFRGGARPASGDETDARMRRGGLPPTSLGCRGRALPNCHAR